MRYDVYGWVTAAPAFDDDALIVRNDTSTAVGALGGTRTDLINNALVGTGSITSASFDVTGYDYLGIRFYHHDTSVPLTSS